jgi:hypothetical protein
MTSPAFSSRLAAWQLAGLFILALALRLLLLFSGPWSQPERAEQPDSSRYLLLAENLREYHTFGLEEPDGLIHQAVARLRTANGTLPPADANGLRPESFRTPGYPAFIALVQLLGGGLRAVLMVQCFLGAASACLTAGIAQFLGLSPRAAFLTGLLWAIHPGLIVGDCLILTESLFNALIVMALFLAGRMRSALEMAGVGFLLALATLVRPLGLLFLPAALAMAWPNLRSKILTPVIVIVASCLPLGAWALRNATVGEGFRLTNVGDLNLLYYTAAYSRSEQRGLDWAEDWPAQVSELTVELGNRLGPGDDVVLAARRLAWEEISARPAAVAKVQAKSWLKLAIDHSLPTLATSLGRTYQPSGLFSNLVLSPQRKQGIGEDPGPQPEQGTSLALRVAALLWMGLNTLIALAAIGGTLKAFRQRQWRMLIAGSLTALLFVIATGSVGLERFRLPIMLPLFLLAANLILGRFQGIALKQPSCH